MSVFAHEKQRLGLPEPLSQALSRCLCLIVERVSAIKIECGSWSMKWNTGVECLGSSVAPKLSGASL